MPIYLQPRADADRTAFLSRTASTADTDRAATPARRLVNDDPLAAVRTFLPTFSRPPPTPSTPPSPAG